jgi:hypothetical protein
MRKLVPALSLIVALVLSSAAQNKWPGKSWPVSAPGDLAMDPAELKALDKDLASGKYGYIDHMLVIRHGMAVYDRSYKNNYDTIYHDQARARGPLNPDLTGPYNYFDPDWHPFYHRGDLHTLQSVTKSMTSVTLGVAMTRNELPGLTLETPIIRFFDADKVANLDDRKRRITLRNLLTMTAGFDWNEDLPYSDPKNSGSAMEASTDWVKFVIDRPMAHEPGTVFAYNSGVSELFSYIFKKATGQNIDDYAGKNVFKPLGIQHYHWKRTKMGLADTEGGLYLNPHDLARVGYLFLKGGMWDGKQILSADWIKESVSPSVADARGFKYGFQWWLIPHGNSNQSLAWACLGFGGQFLLVVPEYDLVAVFNAWNIESQKHLSPRDALDRVLRAVNETNLRQ